MVLEDAAEWIAVKEVNALSAALEDPHATLTSMIEAFVTEADIAGDPSDARISALQQRVVLIDMVTECYKDKTFC